MGFVPTGWMYEMKRSTFPTRNKGPCTVHLVPYSEHSSYEELREYVRFLKPHQVMLNAELEIYSLQKSLLNAMLSHFALAEHCRPMRCSMASS